MSSVKLFHGDCLELMKDIPDGSVDCVITDPPYGTTACDWDKRFDLNRFFKESFSCLKKKWRPNCFFSTALLFRTCQCL